MDTKTNTSSPKSRPTNTRGKMYNKSVIRAIHLNGESNRKNRPITHQHLVSNETKINTNTPKQTTQRFRMKQRPAPKGTKQLIPIKRKEKDVPIGYDDSIKIIPLGGLGEIGRNMHILEYKDEILIIDVGFGFPESDQPGIDYNLPNIDYLKDKIDKIQAIIITHGHYDHIGGLPYIIDKLGNPPIYTSRLSSGIIQKRHSEFPHLPSLDITHINHKTVIQVGKYFKIEFVHMNHNIPEDFALFIETPGGNIFHTGDFKFDPEPYKEQPTDLENLKNIGTRGIHLLMSDSTGADRDGISISETEIMRNLEEIFKIAKGRIIAATFSSLINRIQQMITLSEKYGRKVIIDGFSMKSNIEIMKEMGEIDIKKDTQISGEQIDDYPDNQITVIGTGAQGEERAVMMRIVSGTHRNIQLKESDSAIFSSSVIPGNERTVQRLHDLLSRVGVTVYHYKMMDIHAGGHAASDDLKLLIRLLRPKFLMPIHGYYYMMAAHRDHGISEGLEKDNVILADNGNIIHLTQEEWWYDKKTANVENVMVDGLGVGDVGNVVIRDRQVLAEEGMFMVVVLVNGRTGIVQGSPDIISRGFVYLKDNRELLTETRKRVRQIVQKVVSKPINTTDIKNALRDEIGLFLFQKTERRPMILPVVIEV